MSIKTYKSLIYKLVEVIFLSSTIIKLTRQFMSASLINVAYSPLLEGHIPHRATSPPPPHTQDHHPHRTPPPVKNLPPSSTSC